MTDTETFVPEDFKVEDLDLDEYWVAGFSEYQVLLVNKLTHAKVLRDSKRTHWLTRPRRQRAPRS